MTVKLMQNLHMTVNLTDSKEEVEAVCGRKMRREDGADFSAVTARRRRNGCERGLNK
jgi:hypothetical protein